MTGRPGQTRPPAKEKEKGRNIWKRKIFALWRRRGTEREKEERQIFAPQRRRTEEENIWPAEEKKKGKGKGGNYSEKRMVMTVKQTDEQHFVL